MRLPPILLSSDELSGIYWSENQPSDYENYLYHTKDGQIEFLIIEDDIKQLNDYLFLASESIIYKIEQISKNYKKYSGIASRITKETLDDWEIANDVIMDSEFTMPIWQDTLNFLMPAFSTLAIYTVLERSLKYLCYVFCSSQPKLKPNQSKVSAYLFHLENQFSYKANDESYAYIDRCRLIRNNFAHGNWDKVREQQQEINLPELFKSVSNILMATEHAIGDTKSVNAYHTFK
jgi:hypothetical protein